MPRGRAIEFQHGDRLTETHSKAIDRALKILQPAFNANIDGLDGIRDQLIQMLQLPPAQPLQAQPAPLPPAQLPPVQVQPVGAPVAQDPIGSDSPQQQRSRETRRWPCAMTRSDQVVARVIIAQEGVLPNVELVNKER